MSEVYSPSNAVITDGTVFLSEMHSSVCLICIACENAVFPSQGRATDYDTRV